jgi:hypothetical protein
VERLSSDKRVVVERLTLQGGLLIPCARGPC